MMRVTFSEPFLLAALLTALTRDARWMLLLWLAAALHEGGHLLALRLFGGQAAQLRFRLSGLEIRYRGAGLSYGRETAVALAGPAANLLWAAGISLANRGWQAPMLHLFCGCHLALALFNLLPALPLDGGRALSCLLCSRWPQRGEGIVRIVSGGIALALLGAGTALLAQRKNPTLLAAGLLIFAQVVGNPLYTAEKNR